MSKEHIKAAKEIVSSYALHHSTGSRTSEIVEVLLRHFPASDAEENTRLKARVEDLEPSNRLLRAIIDHQRGKLKEAGRILKEAKDALGVSLWDDVAVKHSIAQISTFLSALIAGEESH